MKVSAYIHSLKNMNNGSNTLGETEIIKQIGDNLYLAEYNGIKCTAIFNCFTNSYYVDDVYGIQKEQQHYYVIEDNKKKDNPLIVRFSGLSFLYILIIYILIAIC